MTRLSVNLNKVALIRNARGGNLPDLIQVAKDCEAFGAQGITVHPRPDERHVRIADLPLLKEAVTTEFNIEGNPTPKFIDFTIQNRPHQVTLVPDKPHALTSDAGWDTVAEYDFLKKITAKFQEFGIRVSIFVNPVAEMVEGAKRIGAERIELYTGNFAKNFDADPAKAIAPFIEAANVANELQIDINAGHDLNLQNLAYFNQHIPKLKEVSMGHALISDALYFGLQNTIQMYLARLK